MDLGTTLLKTVRLAPGWLELDAAAFIAQAYQDCLGRECEFDEAERAVMVPAGDRYVARTTYLRDTLCSAEARGRGHAAMADAVAAVLVGRQRAPVAELLRARYPTVESLVDGLVELMAHVRDNSQRQDAILALAGAAPRRAARLSSGAR